MTPMLADAIFWVAVAACAVAQVGILRATFRRGAAPVSGAPVRRRATRAEELAWAVIPVILLTVTLVLTWRALHPSASHPAAVSQATGAAA